MMKKILFSSIILVFLLFSCKFGVGVDPSASGGTEGGVSAETMKVAAPILGVATSVQTADFLLDIRTDTPGAVIYYTLDGSEPTKDSSKYTASFLVNKTMTVKAKAYLTGWTDSDITTADYTFEVQDPVISPILDDSNSTYPIYVSINVNTLGAAIYYTTDGSDPKVNGTLYTGQFKLDGLTTIRAVARKEGWSDSGEKSGTYTFELVAPVISPSDKDKDGNETVYLYPFNTTLVTHTVGAKIYYTLDNSTPTVNSFEYNGTEIPMDRGKTIKAITVKNGWETSDVTEVSYSFKVLDPVFSPAGGSYNTPLNVSIPTGTNSATIYYTTDGSDPDTNGTVLSGTLAVGSNMTVRVIAKKDLCADSEEINATYSFKVDNPVIFPKSDSGSYASNGPVRITLSNYTNASDIKMYYALDNSTDLTVGGTLYTEPFDVNESGTLRVRARKDGWNPSDEVNATYQINEADISVMLSGGTYPANGKIMLTDSGANDTILGIKDATADGTFTFDNSSNHYKFHTSSGSYFTYNLYYFTDIDGNGSYDADSFAESSSRFLIKSIPMASYIGSATIDAGTYQINKYYGTITYHADWNDASRRYLYTNNSFTGIERIIPVASNGTFELYTKKPDPKSKVSIYTFEDNSSNQNKEMNELEDNICFLMASNEHHSNVLINESIAKVYGKAVFNDSQNSTIFNFASGTNPPVLKVEDQAYWYDFYQKIGTDGSFAAYVAKGHNIDIRIYDVLSTVGTYATQFKDYLRFPVRMAGATSYWSDTQLLGVNGADIEIHTHTVKIYNKGTSYPNDRLFLLVGQSPIPYQLYALSGSDVQNSEATAPYDASGTLYKVFYRDFDRTTATSGILNDAAQSTTTSGYGAFASFQAFVDFNKDGLKNPGEVVTNTMYVGDGNSPNGSPDGTKDGTDSGTTFEMSRDRDFSSYVLDFNPGEIVLENFESDNNWTSYIDDNGTLFSGTAVVERNSTAPQEGSYYLTFNYEKYDEVNETVDPYGAGPDQQGWWNTNTNGGIWEVGAEMKLSSTVNVSPFSRFELYYKWEQTGSNTSQPLKIDFVDADSAGNYQLFSVTKTVSDTGGTWTKMTIYFSELSIKAAYPVAQDTLSKGKWMSETMSGNGLFDKLNLSGIRFYVSRDTDKGILHVDNIIVK